MLGRALLLLVLPLATALAQAASPIRISIGDHAGNERYKLVRWDRDSLSPGATTKAIETYLQGEAVILSNSATHDSATVLTQDQAVPVHVSVSNGRSVVSAVGTMVMIRINGDSVRLETRSPSTLPPSIQLW